MLYKNELGSVFYQVYGADDAPAIVLSHGVAMDHRTFAQQVEALKDDYRVVVWDMPYHGKSSSIDNSLRFSRTAVDFIIGLMDTLGIQAAVMAGQSLGSFVAQQAAHRYPDRVTATVHISGGSLYPKYPSALKVLKPLMPMLKLYPERLLANSFAKHKALRQDTRAYLVETVSATGTDALIHLTNEMLQDMVDGLPERPGQPMLIVYGDHDISFVRRMSTKWHAAEPASQLVKINDAHHILNQDNPEAFNLELLKYLASLNL